MSFSQLPAVEKDTENGAPGASYFGTALVKITWGSLNLKFPMGACAYLIP